jgi:uncharacterized protein (DUF2235 family)
MYTIEINEPLEDRGTPKQLALFMDGTANDRNSRTNVAKMSEIVINQDLDNLYVFYNEGVGTDGKIIGGATGWGQGNDVAEAYAFLSEYYSSDSSIHLFGFSRGAYSSRILAGMLYAVGIYDLNKFNPKDRIKISRDVYAKYKKGSKKKCT